MTTHVVPATNNNVYLPFGGNTVNLGEEAVTPSPEYPLLQYATGLPAQRPKLDVEGYQLYDEETGEEIFDNLYYAGFFTECDKDKALDDAMCAMKVPWIHITHGNGEVKKHWAVQKPTVFLLARGIPSNSNTQGALGMAYAWRTKRNSTRQESVLYVQVMLRHLLPLYTKPFVFTVKSTQTVDALNAMKRQYKVLRCAHEELQRAGQDMPLPLWSYSLVFGPSKKQEIRGNGTEGNSKTIFPMLSGVPDEINGAYLQRHEVPLEYADLLKDCTEKAVDWAQALTQRIVSGVESHEPWQQTSSGPTED